MVAIPDSVLTPTPPPPPSQVFAPFFLAHTKNGLLFQFFTNRD